MRIGFAPLVIVALGGCGRIGFDAAGTNARDAGPAHPTGPFSNVGRVNLPVLGNDDDPSLTADQLELFFDRGSDIYTATRATTSDAWTTPLRVASLSDPAGDTTPEVAADGLMIHFASQRGGGGMEIYVAFRSSRSVAWQPPIHVPELGGPGADTAGRVTADGLMIAFDSTRPTAGGDYNVYASTRPTNLTSQWDPPVELASLSTVDGEGSPHLSDDKLAIYFDSDRSGNHAIYVATRASVTEEFGNVQMVEGIDTPMNEEDPWVSADGRVIFFTSDRTGTTQLYEASR